MKEEIFIGGVLIKNNIHPAFLTRRLKSGYNIWFVDYDCECANEVNPNGRMGFVNKEF